MTSNSGGSSFGPQPQVRKPPEIPPGMNPPEVFRRLLAGFPTFEPDDYQLGNTLGKGAYGEVKIVISKTLPPPGSKKFPPSYAMKEINFRRFLLDPKVAYRTMQQFAREIGIQKYLGEKSGCTPRFYGYALGKDSLYLLIELIPGSELMDFIDPRSGKNRASWKGSRPWTLEERGKILLSITTCLATLHQAGIAHRDLKAENVRMHSRQGRAILVDFGFSCHIGNGTEILEGKKTQYNCSSSAQGTPYYMAPEVWDDKVTDFLATDIFALGILFHEILTGKTPYDAPSNYQLYLSSKHASDFIELDEIPDSRIRGRLSVLLIEMLHSDPTERPSVTEVLQRVKEIFAL